MGWRGRKDCRATSIPEGSFAWNDEDLDDGEDNVGCWLAGLRKTSTEGTWLRKNHRLQADDGMRLLAGQEHTKALVRLPYWWRTLGTWPQIILTSLTITRAASDVFDGTSQWPAAAQAHGLCTVFLEPASRKDVFRCFVAVVPDTPSVENAKMQTTV